VPLKVGEDGDWSFVGAHGTLATSIPTESILIYGSGLVFICV